MSKRLTTVTGYQSTPVTLCGELHPDAPKYFCTREDPDHQGDHHHEYTGTTWPREARHHR